MATTVEKVEQALTKAEKELEDAKTALQEFKDGDNQGKWLEELRTKLRKEEGTAAQRADWKEERTQLEKEKERLEKAVEDCRVVWAKRDEDLRRARAAGNDGCWGHRVVCTWVE